ncbi:MAG TPA: LPS assembly protein LptD, partial [Opitutaceae bacterium]|nr:LPS assembly protein LptD [Opitutaceae bacterium]
METCNPRPMPLQGRVGPPQRGLSLAPLREIHDALRVHSTWMLACVPVGWLARRSVIRRLFLFTLVLATAQAELAAAELPKPGKNFDFTSDSGAEFDFGTRDFVGRGHARLTYGDATLFADEIRYQQDTKIAKVKGHVSITRDALRLVADSGTYNFSTGELSVVNLRMGDYPVYLSGDTVMGNLKELTFTNAALTFKEPNSATPSIHADRITYIPGQRIIAEHVRMGIGTYRPLYLSKIEQSLTAPFLNDSTFEAGYRHNLGAWFDFGLRLPVAEGVKLGGELGVYTARGIMFGPTGSYILKQGESETTGYFRSGFIHDTGSTGLDILNRPISKSRGYVEWQQRSQITDNLTFVGQLNYWKDSEVLRDFRARAFYNMQQPDSYLESVYTGKNYFVSLFARLRPNNFEDVQQRMPEVRFDLLPTAIGEGFYERFNVSGAILREDPLTLDPLTGNYIRGSVLRSDRFDAYYALTRPFLPREWLSFTPVVGGRLTYYNQALAGKNNYTRTLGEFGFDAALRANGVYNYKNEFWKIDGIRHLLEPKLSYRYTPEAEQGSRYIPQIDRQVFNTNLQPISLGDMRNIDQLQKLNVVRLGLDNTFQTRDSKYGSRDLLTVNFAN